MNWLLLLVLAIILVNGLIGMKKGLIKVVFSMVSMFLAMVLTALISPTVTGMLSNNDTIYTYVSDKVEQMVDANEEQVDSSNEDSFIENLRLPKSIKENLVENRDKGMSNFKGYITESISKIILKAAGFVLTFIVSLILIWVLSKVLDIISKLPVLNQINKSAGLIAGLVHGLILVWIFFAIITVFGGTGFGQSALAAVEESVILSFVYDKNFLTRHLVNAGIFLGIK